MKYIFSVKLMKNGLSALILVCIVFLFGTIIVKNRINPKGLETVPENPESRTEEISTDDPQTNPTPEELLNMIYGGAIIGVPDVGVEVEITGQVTEYGDYENDKESPYGTITFTGYALMLPGGEIATVVAVNNGGSGEFFYLAIFDESDGILYIADYVLLGDRVDIKSLKADDNIITIVYMEHGEGQSMAEEPNLEVTKTFEYSNGQLTEK